MLNLKRILFLSCAIFGAVAASFAQTPPVENSVTVVNTAAAPVDPKPADYKLGAGDQVVIRASNVPDITDKQFRIDTNGFIAAPIIGRIHAAGLTVVELETQLNQKLGVFLQQPDATVNVVEYQSQPISLFGELMLPGVHQLQGRKTLVEMLSTGGGVKANAGPIVIITRKLEYGRIPLPDAKDDATGKFSVATLPLKPLIGGESPDKDILIMPYDIISVPRAELIYVAGDVARSGPLSLTERPTISVLEAISATGGVTKTADTKRARIMRLVPGNAVREQVPVNLAGIMTGKASDLQLRAGDILVVPPSSTKRAAQRALEVAIQLGTVIVSSGLINGTI